MTFMLGVMLPPFLLIFILLLLYIGLWASSHINLCLKDCVKFPFTLNRKVYHKTLDEEDLEEDQINSTQFKQQNTGFLPKEKENLSQLERSIHFSSDELRRMVKSAQDNIFPLIIIMFPGIISTLACPLIIKIGPMFVDTMWPEGFPVDDVNDALAIFLVPASLLYALLFTLSFEFVYEKQSVIRAHLNKEVNLLYETLNLSHNFSSQDQFHSTLIHLEIAKVVHEQALDLVDQLKGPCLKKTFLDNTGTYSDHNFSKTTFLEKVLKNNDVKIPSQTKKYSQIDVKFNKEYSRKLWTLLPQIRKLVQIGGGDSINSILLSKTMDTIMDFTEAVTQRRAVTQQKINYVQWAFLEILGFISFLAVLLIKADSVRFELTMCMLTAFSISLLNLVISDIDEPFHGFFKIDTSCLIQLVQQTSTEIQWMRASLGAAAISSQVTNIPDKAKMIVQEIQKNKEVHSPEAMFNPDVL